MTPASLIEQEITAAQDAFFPLSIRHAAEQLSTPITRQQTAPFTTNPVADARLIITHLAGIR